MDIGIVTTARNTTAELKEKARELAASQGLIYRERKDISAANLLQNGQYLIVYTQQGPEIVTKDGTHRFHLSMAQLRIENLIKGGQDHFIQALGRKRPLRILDCTFGFGSDALTASWYLNREGTVTGVESSLPMYIAGSWGCREFIHENPEVTAALRRITVIHASYQEYLKKIPKGAYDVIYFDPMFAHPVMASPQFHPVRQVLNHEPLEADILELARQKAGNRVVVKGRAFRKWKSQYPDMQIMGGRYSKVQYAVWEV